MEGVGWKVLSTEVHGGKKERGIDHVWSRVVARTFQSRLETASLAAPLGKQKSIVANSNSLSASRSHSLPIAILSHYSHPVSLLFSSPNFLTSKPNINKTAHHISAISHLIQIWQSPNLLLQLPSQPASTSYYGVKVSIPFTQPSNLPKHA